MNTNNCPVLGFVGWSGTGKTTLLKKIIQSLNNINIKMAVIKHAHHDFEIDIPGKDSYELRHAGATQMLVASNRRWALINENSKPKKQPELYNLLQKLDYTNLDIILVEGFKHENFDKIELHRASMHKPLLYLDDKNIIAVVTERSLTINCNLPTLDINDSDTIVAFILNKYKLG